MKKRSMIYLYLLLMIFIPTPLFAYIDPMSGSTILYVLFALLATLFYSLIGVFYRFKNMLAGRGFSSQESFEAVDIVFFSEGKQYWNVYLPVIRALEKLQVRCAYVTADLSDPAIEYESPFLEVKALGSMNSAMAFMNQLSSPLVVTTTPQLDIFTLKKSKKVQHYSHLLHSPTDTHTYRQFAFDYFDSVLCSGPYQIKSIREVEKKRHTPAKQLLETGLTYYDIMKEECVAERTVLKNKNPRSRAPRDLCSERMRQVAKNARPSSPEQAPVYSGPPNEKPSVLVAPTWQSYSLLNRFGVTFFRELLSDDYKIIFRPHPQSFVSFPALVQEVVDAFGDEDNFILDRNPSGSESMNASSVMISDLSGVIYDYLFLYEKPVILMDTHMNTDGMEAYDIDYEMWDKTLCRSAGKTILEDEIPQLSSIVKKMLNQPLSGEIKKIRDEALYNFGTAGETAASQLLKIVEELKC